MSKSFEEAIEESLKHEWYGEEIERIYGITSVGQRFAFVTTKYKWFAVRLYMHEDHLENRILGVYEKSQHTTLSAAQQYVVQRISKLQSATESLADYSREWKLPLRQITIVRMPSDCRDDPDKYLKPGDHIMTKYAKLETHDAIYVGNKKVIHISRPGLLNGQKNKAEAWACEDDWSNFISNDNYIAVQVYRVRMFKPDDIIQRARGRAEVSYGRGEYSVLENNCQHFASWCACGQDISSASALFKVQLPSALLITTVMFMAPFLLMKKR